MASIGHIAVGMAAGRLYCGKGASRGQLARAMAGFSALSMLPDAAHAPALEAPALQPTGAMIAELPTASTPKTNLMRWLIPLVLVACIVGAAAYEWYRGGMGNPGEAARASPEGSEKTALMAVPAQSVIALPNPLANEGKPAAEAPSATAAAATGAAAAPATNAAARHPPPDTASTMALPSPWGPDSAPAAVQAEPRKNTAAARAPQNNTTVRRNISPSRCARPPAARRRR